MINCSKNKSCRTETIKAGFWRDSHKDGGAGESGIEERESKGTDRVIWVKFYKKEDARYGSLVCAGAIGLSLILSSSTQSQQCR